MKHIICAALLSVLLTGCDVSFNKTPPKTIASEPSTEEQQRQVFNATVEFLQLLDTGRVNQTWSTSSPLLQATTSELMWTNGIKAIRLGLGDYVERTSANIGFTTQMPDVPAGSYAVVECVTTFSTGPAMENIVLRDDDNQWRVVGYSVNKRFLGGDEPDNKSP
ncbi:DUF4019 domain-containing protein [Pseudomonas sp. P115]|uniref:DUF4019 domain-containing protein n=1 Tax=Pseudomonas pisciculturae TaxID=2730413 RepID=UPI0018924836|nr:DUF4019 domain-containing protein [Pseudomonas pisciculturae]MBF6030996.1 DUF4019 domain-containing protein [Pseudomonas pisciculturae]